MKQKTHKSLNLLKISIPCYAVILCLSIVKGALELWLASTVQHQICWCLIIAI